VKSHISKSAANIPGWAVHLQLGVAVMTTPVMCVPAAVAAAADVGGDCAEQ